MWASFVMWNTAMKCMAHILCWPESGPLSWIILELFSETYTGPDRVDMVKLGWDVAHIVHIRFGALRAKWLHLALWLWVAVQGEGETIREEQTPLDFHILSTSTYVISYPFIYICLKMTIINQLKKTNKHSMRWSSNDEIMQNTNTKTCAFAKIREQKQLRGSFFFL